MLGSAMLAAVATWSVAEVGASATAAPLCEFDNIFGAGSPPYYVAYHLGEPRHGAAAVAGEWHLSGQA